MAALAQAGNRLALVIGNSDYQNSRLSYLPNPIKDAALIKNTLKQLAFEVIYAENLDKGGMDKVVKRFTRRLQRGDIAFFYYAGHGSSYAGQSYLLPLKSDIDSATQLQYRANNAQEILDLMSEKASSSIFILDACRDTLFSRSTTRGLASINSGKGTYVIYAADQGQVALDNRVFAKSLASELLKSQSIRDVALETRKTVLSVSDGQQYPATYDKLLERIYLRGKPSPKPKPQVANTTDPPMQSVQSTEIPNPVQAEPTKTEPQKQGTKIDHYIAYNDGTALDTKTGLLWQRCTYGERWNGTGCSGEPQAMDWQTAMQLKNNGWRLPTIEELKTIVYCSSGKPKGVYPGQLVFGCEGNYQSPTINTSVFPMQKHYYYVNENDKATDKRAWWDAFYWSSSPSADFNNGAWGVYFYDGDAHVYLKDSSRYVRLVRSL